MANIKSVRVEGDLPFDCAEDGEMSRWLAVMNGPTFGLRIQWFGRTRDVPNEHGGTTAFYSFRIAGEEAVRWNALDNLKECVLRLGGNLTVDESYDLEVDGE